MTSFSGWNEMGSGESREEFLCVLAKLQFWMLVDLNRGEVPHAGEESGDLCTGGGFFMRFRWGKEQGAVLRVYQDQGGKNNFDGVAFFAFFGNGGGEAKFARFAEFGDRTE